MWLCRCECGTERTVWSPHLKNGRTRSCGCIKREHLAKLSAAKVTHGKTHTVEYRIWAGIVDRCTNPKNKDNLEGLVLLVDQMRRDARRHELDRIHRPGSVIAGYS
jgi:hypothetical protein